jgi:hypothetical protein
MAEAAPAVDVKTFHAKIGELTLENDFWDQRPDDGSRMNREVHVRF